MNNLVDNTEKGASPESSSRPSGFQNYIKTLGIAGFLFFLFKGLVWLAIFWGIGKSC